MDATPLPPGPRDTLVTRRVAELLAALDPALVEREPLDGAEGPRRLARHVATIVERELLALGEDSHAQADIANRLVGVAGPETRISDELVELPPELWAGLRGSGNGLSGASQEIVRPATPMSTSDLLVNAEGQPNVGSELRAELASAERVDLICAFVIWSGVVQLRDGIADVIRRGGDVRIITTTYMGATQRRAVDELVRLGAKVRVAFDARTTKLHAKAWLLERSSGLTTAFIGSSNLSHTALFDGLEWNVRLSAADAPHVIDRVRAMFDSHWESEHFEPYDPARDAEKLDRALGEHRRDPSAAISFVGVDVHPYPHQRRMLDELRVQRERHNRHRNLVVAATGTGKTVIAALDYRRLAQEAGRQPSLLFVAHRERILEQSLATFRTVLRDGSFGEIHGGGRIASGDHVFAMVQSLSRAEIERLSPDRFDVVIIDEFHHAAAPSYRRILGRVSSKELLGLTATPERMDGQDVTEFFSGRIAVELRLWEAIDEGFLVPFQYFGVADGTDLSSLRWRRGGYATDDLNRVLTGNDARVAILLRALERVIADPSSMRALGFCVSREHARYMAARFTEAGLPSAHINGDMPQPDRDAILRQLQSGDLRTIFSVDVLGEGVDVPAVDTVLLLRPTDSATVFTQQLGRGLRRAEGKPYLSVIDLIGQQHREFRFDRRLQALLDIRRGSVSRQIEEGFPFLPSGCHLELDRQSRETILTNLRSAARLTQVRALTADLRQLGDVSMAEFLVKTGRTPSDLYRSADASWTRLRRDAGFEAHAQTADNDERTLLRAVRRMLHIDDPERVRFYRDLLSASRKPAATSLDERHRRLLFMLQLDLWGTSRGFQDLDAFLAKLWPHEPVRSELVEVLGVLDELSEHLPQPSRLPAEVPLHTHALYSRDEVLAAYAQGSPARPPQHREGIKYVREAATDLFFVTLKKSERDYSPTTMYRDYAISRELFHWESQSVQHATSPSIERYRDHAARGNTILLFVRERKQTAISTTMPYAFLGRARYVSSEGDRPVAFVWRLETPMPEELFEMARTVAA